MLRIEIANPQDCVPVDRTRLRRAVRSVLREAGITQAVVSVAIVDDSTIKALHRRHLGLDCPTDVLSFLLERGNSHLEGEIVVGAQTAQSQAARYGWAPEDELLLYVVHGALHLIGYDDLTARQRTAMRARERECLAQFGLKPRYTAVGKRRKRLASRR